MLLIPLHVSSNAASTASVCCTHRYASRIGACSHACSQAAAVLPPDCLTVSRLQTSTCCCPLPAARTCMLVCCCCRIDKAQVADATVRGGRARYINHCCDPNCRPKEFYGPDGVARMGIYAHRDIELGEELHYNYHVSHMQGRVCRMYRGPCADSNQGVPAGGRCFHCGCAEPPPHPRPPPAFAPQAALMCHLNCARPAHPAGPMLRLLVPLSVLQFEFEDEDRRVPCYCGAANCSGWMNWEEGVEQRATG